VSEKDTLIVTGAGYQHVVDAEADYEAVNAAYHDLGTSHEFDAAVLARGEDGEVTILKQPEQPTRHGAPHRLGPGFAIAIACAIFSAVGLLGGSRDQAVAPARRIGAVTGHMKRRMDDEDLEAIGTVLSQGQAGLIVVYAVNMADRIAANMKSVDTAAISKKIDANADELARQLIRWSRPPEPQLISAMPARWLSASPSPSPFSRSGAVV
jgi:uncharacterized membrane protein